MVTLHVIILLATLGVVLLADHEALDYLRGKKPLLSRERLVLLHRLVWAGLLGMLSTGAFLFWPRRSFLVHDPAFYFKMLFVGFLIVNASVIGRLMHLASIKGYRELTREERHTLFISGAVSLGSWACAILLGLVLA